MKLNLLRGKILRLLSDFYPDGIEQTQLIGIYHAYDKTDDIVKSAAYLVDKGFVQKTQVPHPYKEGMKITYYKITPKGLDLIEGNAEADSGILVPREA